MRRLSGKQLLTNDDYINLDADSKERLVIDALSTFYTNFAKFGFVYQFRKQKLLSSFLTFSVFLCCLFFAFYLWCQNRNPLHENDPIPFYERINGSDSYHFLDITNRGNVIVKSNPNRERIQFWDDIFETYSQHWQTREFNLNSLAVKIPLLMLSVLLSSILFCKGIKICLRRNNKSISVA